MFESVAVSWSLEHEDYRRLLRWAATLHEIGLSVSHSQYHKHGAYLLTHLDLPGFARGEQRRLATLVRGHRRKLPVAEFERLPAEHEKAMLRLGVILRIAIVMHRRRSGESIPALKVSADGANLKMVFPEDWLSEHPLLRADLESEAGYLKGAGFKLKVK